MIPTMIDMLCHCAPYFNKKDYLAKVPADVIASFNSTTKTLHESLRPKLAELWKAWAAKNFESLRQISAASASEAPAIAAADNEDLADAFGS
mmetsp:Transcript_21405/g.44963  ORF Transcript_21405/g.44963 Transcript_21405/m.44963 type:complete len:92 (+) Transcript_21405:397-672(+)